MDEMVYGSGPRESYHLSHRLKLVENLTGVTGIIDKSFVGIRSACCVCVFVLGGPILC